MGANDGEALVTGLLWWQPYSGATIVTLDMTVGDLQVTPERLGGDRVRTLSGGVQSTWVSAGDRVSLQVAPALEVTEDSTERTTRDRLHLLVDHLQRGGEVGLAGEKASLWAGITGNLLLPGTSFSATNSLRSIYAGTLSAGSRLVMVGSTPIEAREEGRVSAASAPSYTLSDATLVGLGSAAIVRHRYTYPVLKLAPGSEAVISSRRGVVYGLDLELVEELARVREVLSVGVGGDLRVGAPPELARVWTVPARSGPFR